MAVELGGIAARSVVADVLALAAGPDDVTAVVHAGPVGHGNVRRGEAVAGRAVGRCFHGDAHGSSVGAGNDRSRPAHPGERVAGRYGRTVRWLERVRLAWAKRPADPVIDETGPGWFPDPLNPARVRWYDGKRWGPVR